MGSSSESGRFETSGGDTACQDAPLSLERMTSVCARRAGAVEVGKSNVEAAKNAMLSRFTPIVGSAACLPT